MRYPYDDYQLGDSEIDFENGKAIRLDFEL